MAEEAQMLGVTERTFCRWSGRYQAESRSVAGPWPGGAGLYTCWPVKHFHFKTEISRL